MPKPKSPGNKPESPTPRARQLRITLLGTKPKIWRRVLLPADVSLGDLHAVIQVAMGWEDAHLHEFTRRGKKLTRKEEDELRRRADKLDVDLRELTGERTFSDPSFELEFAEDEFAVQLAEVAPAARSKLSYLYDMGDSWEHEVLVEKLIEPEPGTPILQCLGGEGACPPEDSGGVWGYYDKLDALKDPDHEIHDEAVDWLGDDFDPDAFDVARVNRDLFATCRRKKW
jgi:hypothetical protein